MSSAYLAEIAEQPGIIEGLGTRFAASWGDALAEIRGRLATTEFERVILTGMGGSLHGSYPTQLALSRALSIPVMLWETGELMLQTANVVTERTLLIAVSQSGESGELHRLMASKKRPACVLAVTNGETNSLAKWADLAITTEAGPERTASTKTYTAGLVGLHLLAAHLTGQGEGAGDEIVGLSRTLQKMLPQMPAYADAAVTHLGSTAPLTVVARGESYGSAAMGALLIEEAAKLTCEPLTGGQFRHGPLELVREGFRAIVFLGSGEARPLTEAILARIAALGGRALSIGTNPGPRTDAVFPIALPALAPALLPIVEIIPIQYLVIPLAIARGFEPAAFLNAQKVTTGE